MKNSASGTDARANDATVFAWLRLLRVFHKIDRAASERFAGQGLTVAQFDVIAQLGAAEGITQQELADRLLVTKGNVSQLLAKLERRGWIRRCQEGRANALFLTPAGREIFATIVPDHEAFIATRFAALSPEERRTLHRLLRDLDHALE